MAEFYTNLRILSQDLYKRSKNESGGVTTPANRRTLLGGMKGVASSSSLLAHTNPTKTPDRSSSHADYFATQSMQERIRQYAEEGGIPVEFLDRYNQDVKRKNTETAATMLS
jgi:hypothetical protein